MSAHVFPTDITILADPLTTRNTIYIHTTMDPYEDLGTLIGRVKAGDVPGAQELTAILEHVRGCINTKRNR